MAVLLLPVLMENMDFFDPKTGKWNTKTILGDTINPSFRATAHTATDFFMLSIGNPALLYKTSTTGMKLVYAEENEAVFYDSMKFWNNEEGIAIGRSYRRLPFHNYYAERR